MTEKDVSSHTGAMHFTCHSLDGHGEQAPFLNYQGLSQKSEKKSVSGKKEVIRRCGEEDA